MKTILCNDCGKVMSRFHNTCTRCSRTNLSFFDSLDNEDLKNRRREIKEESQDPMLRVAAFVLLFGIVFCFAAGVSSTYNKMTLAGAQTQKAEAPQAVLDHPNAPIIVDHKAQKTAQSKNQSVQ